MSRIPLPGNGAEALQKGVAEGIRLYTQNRQHAGNMKQREEHFGKTMDFSEMQLGQQWKQHLNDLAVRQAQQDIALENQRMLQAQHPYTLENLEAQAAHHRAQTSGLQFDQNLMQQMMNGGIGGNMNQPNQMPQNPQIPQQQPFMNGQGPIPFNSMGNQGMGAPIAPPMPEGGFAGLNPMLAALIKKRTGLDPYAQSPQQKAEREMQQFREKENYKKSQKEDVNQTIPTTATVTGLQKVILSSDNLLPDLEKLSKLAAPGYGGIFSPNDYATYQDTITGALDNMLGAYGLTSTDQNIKSMRHKLERHFGEKDKHYSDRIKETIKDVIARQKAAQNSLNSKKVEITPRSHEESLEDKKLLVYNPLKGRLE